MKNKLFFIVLMIFAMISCEKDTSEIESVNDLIGYWSGDGANVTVELIDDNAYIKEINLSYSGGGSSTTYAAYGYGTDDCMVKDNKFYYQDTRGEFLSKNELSLNYSGHSFTLSK